MAQRRFVLVPLAEIAPSLLHPTSQRTIADLLAACEDRSEVRFLATLASSGESSASEDTPCFGLSAFQRDFA